MVFSSSGRSGYAQQEQFNRLKVFLGEGYAVRGYRETNRIARLEVERISDHTVFVVEGRPEQVFGDMVQEIVKDVGVGLTLARTQATLDKSTVTLKELEARIKAINMTYGHIQPKKERKIAWPKLRR